VFRLVFSDGINVRKNTQNDFLPNFRSGCFGLPFWFRV